MIDMGLGPLGTEDVLIKRKYQWRFTIPDLVGDVKSGVNALPPSKSARPSLDFKEIEAQHLNETVYFAGKPNWKPIALVLYDLKRNEHPIMTWLKWQYDPEAGDWFAPGPGNWKRNEATLEQLDGCGTTCEGWVFENVWPQSIEFGELDYGNSEYITCDLQLRYDRAYLIE
jgi:hypothetical protein